MEDVLDPVDDVVDVDTTQDDPDVDDPQGDEGDSASAGPTDKVDGRKFNPEWSRLLKEMREAAAADPERGPKVADMLTKLRDNYARHQALMEIAPKGLEDVRGWKTTMDALGGPEAAASLMERAATMDAIDERIAAADFSVIGELPENLQQGFYQMVPQALASLAETNPQAFQAAVQPHFQSALKETGLGEALENLYGMLGENEQAKALVKQMFGWYSQQTNGQAPLPANGQKTVDPQVRALQEKLSRYEQSEDQSFVSSVTDSSQKYLEESFGKLADVYVKQLGLTKEQQSDLMESFNEKLTAKLGADAAFQSQLKAFKAMKNRSPETVANYVRSKIDEHAKTTLDGLVKNRYGAMARKPAPRVATPQPTSNGATHVAQIPDQSQWDMDRMTAEGYENTAKKGLYYLKGGKSVQVSRPA